MESTSEFVCLSARSFSQALFGAFLFECRNVLTDESVRQSLVPDSSVMVRSTGSESSFDAHVTVVMLPTIVLQLSYWCNMRATSPSVACLYSGHQLT